MNNLQSMRSDRWQVRLHGALERLNSSLVWIGVTHLLIPLFMGIAHEPSDIVLATARLNSIAGVGQTLERRW